MALAGSAAPGATGHAPIHASDDTTTSGHAPVDTTTSDHAPNDATTPDESSDRIQDNINATTSPASPDTSDNTTIDQTATTQEDPMEGINKALSLAHQLIAESSPVHKPVSNPEPGPIHEDDCELFDLLDECMAELQLQVKALKQGFREMENGAGEPDDS
jgi:hypothetical protein